VYSTGTRKVDILFFCYENTKYSQKQFLHLLLAQGVLTAWKFAGFLPNCQWLQSIYLKQVRGPFPLSYRKQWTDLYRKREGSAITVWTRMCVSREAIHESYSMCKHEYFTLIEEQYTLFQACDWTQTRIWSGISFLPTRELIILKYLVANELVKAKKYLRRAHISHNFKAMQLNHYFSSSILNYPVPLYKANNIFTNITILL
jgi:hypothetical protein